MSRSSGLWILGVSGVALVAAGCSSSGGGTTTESATPAPTVTITDAPSPTAAPTKTTDNSGGGSAGSLSAPPSGSKKLSSETDGGNTYARYKNSSQSPKEVVTFYKGEATKSGYSVKNLNGGGGGWGGYGGSNWGMVAQKDGSYLDVQAGGSSNGPTFFEVCMGGDKSALKHCNNESNDDSEDSRSGGS